MTVTVNGIAHIQITVNNPERCVPFWEKLCHFLEMQTLLRNDDSVYCIGSRTYKKLQTVQYKQGQVFQHSKSLYHSAGE